MSMKYHHFRSYVKNGQIEIMPTNTREQTADISTKPLKYDALFYICV